MQNINKLLGEPALRKIYYFFSFVIFILFSFLYLLGFSNLFYRDSLFFSRFRWLDFGNPFITIVYLIVLTIFFVLILSVMLKIVLTSDRLVEVDDEEEEDEVLPVEKVESRPEFNEEQISMMLAHSQLQEKLDESYVSFSHMVEDIVQAASFSELFEKMLFWSTDLSNSAKGSVILLDKERNLYVHKITGWNSDEKIRFKTLKISPDNSISGEVLKSGRKIFAEDTESYTGFNFRYSEQYESRSFISLPIVIHNNPIGTLNLTDNRKGAYSIGELEVLNIIVRISCLTLELLQHKKNGT